MQTTQKRRNVLMIMCDSLRPDFLSAYGGDCIPTPNIDALAADGVVFDNAITAATVCGPARMSFLTGQFVSGHDTWTNEIPARDGTVYLPERMAEAGYLTAAVGCFDHAPYDKSFGYQYMNVDKGGFQGCDYKAAFEKKYPGRSFYKKTEDGHYDYDEEIYRDHWSADRAMEFIDSYGKTGKAPNGATGADENAPFYLYCGFFAPHGPLIPPQSVAGTIDRAKIPPLIYYDRPDEDIPEVELYRRTFLNPTEEVRNPHAFDEKRMRERELYCELVVDIDNMVGRIVQSLKDNGLYENTTIVFTSDHGSVENSYNVMTKGPWPYKPQLFIPMIIANHPRLEKGTHCDALCGNLDIGATFLDVAGDDRAFGVSRSMIGLADGSVPEREINMSEFCDSCKTLVDKRYTFTYYPFTGRTCLFDREKDPLELVNLGGRPEYLEMERKFMMHVVDFMILAKGVRVEAHDMHPKMTEGIAKKHPKFMDTFDIAYPLSSREQINRLKAWGLDADYNEFCRTHPIKAAYGVYFDDEKK